MKRKAKGKKGREEEDSQASAEEAAGAAAYPSLRGAGYERALAKSMLDGSSPLESEDAIALAAGLSSLTALAEEALLQLRAHCREVGVQALRGEEALQVVRRQHTGHDPLLREARLRLHTIQDTDRQRGGLHIQEEQGQPGLQHTLVRRRRHGRIPWRGEGGVRQGDGDIVLQQRRRVLQVHHGCRSWATRSAPTSRGVCAGSSARHRAWGG